MEITTGETQQALADGSATIVDVREPYEREAGYIDGTSHIPLDQLTAQAATIPKDQPVIFYCRVGGRSAMAAQAFAAGGYDARTMTGGIVAWDAEGRPLAPDGGSVAEH
jgi:rhodanese-related sulfurtransferase